MNRDAAVGSGLSNAKDNSGILKSRRHSAWPGSSAGWKTRATSACRARYRATASAFFDGAPGARPAWRKVAQRQIGVVRAHRQAWRVIGLADLLRKRRAVHSDHAHHHIRMARQVLGWAARAQRQGLAAAPGVVGGYHTPWRRRRCRKRGRSSTSNSANWVTPGTAGACSSDSAQRVPRRREVFHLAPQQGLVDLCVSNTRCRPQARRLGPAWPMLPA